MIYRIFPIQDTYITNLVEFDASKGPPINASGSNVGSAEVLEIFKIAAQFSGTLASNLTGSGWATGSVSGAFNSSISSLFTASLSHVLTQFDFSAISALTASSQFPSTGMTYQLVLKDCPHRGPLPMSFQLEVLALTQPWSAGSGLDTLHYFDPGVANWIYAQQNVLWDVPGASGTMPIPVNFDTGHEDLRADVSQIVNAWLTGGLPNYGFLIRLSSTLEADDNDYRTKMFHSIDTFFDDWRPYLEADFDDSIQDDRNNFTFDNPNNLYLYNRVKGQFVDLPGNPSSVAITIFDVSGNLVITGSGFPTNLPGIYSASFLIPSGTSYSGSLFSDVWSANFPYLTSSVVPITASFLTSSIVDGITGSYESGTILGYSASLYLTCSLIDGYEVMYSASMLTPILSSTLLTAIFPITASFMTSSVVSGITSSWYADAGDVYMTGTFSPVDSFSQPSDSPKEYFVNIENLRNQYRPQEFPRLDMFVRDRDYNPAVILTASSAGPEGLVITNAFYQIENDRTNEVVVPFGTGSNGYAFNTRLSYDENGNWFKFPMGSLSPGEVYRIIFLFNQDGEQQIIDEGFKFRLYYE